MADEETLEERLLGALYGLAEGPATRLVSGGNPPEG